LLCSQAIIVKREGFRASAKVLHCRSWQCEICRPNRAKELIAQAIKGKGKIFITLTVDPSVPPDPVGRCKLLVDAWRKVRKDAEARYGYKRIPFLAVVEATKQGEPHLHIIARVPWISQSWLSNRMRHYLNSPIVWVTQITSRRKLANYVAKYCGKNPQRFGTVKRYWQSINWLRREKKEKRAWYEEGPQFSIIENDLSRQLRTWKYLGYKILFERKWAISIRPGDPEYEGTECQF